ncbi:MAG TPA: DUF5916 domain-containing protein [Gemmatimonadales bacterium]|nr:DUF5916 domain-containing protein [Gemmatimonadales bacterium]
MRYRIVLISLALAYLSGTALPAQPSQEPLRLTRLSAPIVLDGQLDEAAWQAVTPLPLTALTPTFGGPLTERTELRVAYDDRYLYLGGRMFDSEAGKVRTNTLYRDRYSGDDLMAIVLDTYNDRQTASWFAVNPAGARTDRAVSNDGEFSSGDPMNDNWNTFWDVATTRSDSGWSAEMRIPFSSLGFQDDDGRVTMGMIVYRLIARKNERQLFPAIPPNWDLAFAKPSQARRVVIEGVYARRPVYVTPYLLGGSLWRTELNAEETRYLRVPDRTAEAGLDLRYSPTSNLSFDLTVNTDFAQAEADDQQVNLTRFSLFFPEKRQFFQERAAIFEFNTGGISRLFHSRTVGLTEGEPIRLLGGARLVGRVGPWDLGFLDMQTAARDSLASENLGVVRLRRAVFKPNSTIGAMLTSRVTARGRFNLAAGVDAVIRTVGDEYLTAKWAQTYTSDLPNPAVDRNQSLMLLRWERRNQLGLSYSGELIRSGARYDPGMGFAFRRDFSSLELRPQYQWLVGSRTAFRTVGIGVAGGSFWRNSDKTVESAEIASEIGAELKSGQEIGIAVRRSFESIRESFEISGGAGVVPGDYWFTRVELNVMAPRTATFRPSFSISGGSFFDGTRIGLSARPAWNPSRHLELGLDYDYNRVRFGERAERADLHLVRLRLQLALDVHLSLAALAQYDNAEDAFGINARFRYNFREGRDLWVVYNEAMNTERPPEVPRLPLTRSRGFLVKYTHTLGR